MVKFKLSITILVLILATTYSFYYVFNIGVGKDVNRLVKNKITQNAFFVKELMEKTKIKNESQLNEWALSNKIAEKIDDLNDYYIEKKVIEENIKKLEKEATKVGDNTSTGSMHRTVSPIQEEEKDLEGLREELKTVEKEISSIKGDLKTKFSYLTNTLKMNFSFLISKHLSKIEDINKNFKTTKEFIDAIKNGKTDSDIWMRKSFLYNVYGVPIRLNNKVLGTLFIGSKKTKKDADFLTEKIKSEIAFVNHNRVLSTNLNGNSIKREVNKYIMKNEEDLKTLSYNDISKTFKIKVHKDKYMAIFIPLRSYNEKVSGVIIINPLSNDIITIMTKVKYWLPIFSFVIFFLVLMIIFVMNKSFLKPYVDLEIQTNIFLDDGDEEIIPAELGEAEGLARSIKRLIRKTKGEAEPKAESELSLWDDPLFVTELQENVYSSKKKEKDHHDSVYNMFIRAHMNNGLAFEHIKQDDFKKRLKSIEARLKKKFKVEEIYFEVLVDDLGIIKLHPQIVKKKKFIE